MVGRRPSRAHPSGALGALGDALPCTAGGVAGGAGRRRAIAVSSADDFCMCEHAGYPEREAAAAA